MAFKRLFSIFLTGIALAGTACTKPGPATQFKSGKSKTVGVSELNAELSKPENTEALRKGLDITWEMTETEIYLDLYQKLSESYDYDEDVEMDGYVIHSLLNQMDIYQAVAYESGKDPNRVFTGELLEEEGISKEKVLKTGLDKEMMRRVLEAAEQSIATASMLQSELKPSPLDESEEETELRKSKPNSASIGLQRTCRPGSSPNCRCGRGQCWDASAPAPKSPPNGGCPAGTYSYRNAGCLTPPAGSCETARQQKNDSGIARNLGIAATTIAGATGPGAPFVAAAGAFTAAVAGVAEADADAKIARYCTSLRLKHR